MEDRDEIIDNIILLEGYIHSLHPRGSVCVCVQCSIHADNC
jgi:hypothetical protein